MLYYSQMMEKVANVLEFKLIWRSTDYVPIKAALQNYYYYYSVYINSNNIDRGLIGFVIQRTRPGHCVWVVYYTKVEIDYY